MSVPVYYNCGICDHFHPWDWSGDCRDDTSRLTYDDLDKKHGENGYELRSMKDRSAADSVKNQNDPG